MPGYRPPDYTAITHWHWDHSFGMHACTGKTIACNKTNRELEKLSQWEWTDGAMKKRLASGEEIEFADDHIRAEYPDLRQIKAELPPLKRKLPGLFFSLLLFRNKTRYLAWYLT